ncbi:MAG: amidophosphoribosyltransferase, partial [Candidatus Hodarchaeota archaeon]
DDIHSEIILKTNGSALCQFEFVYFARPDSVIDGGSVAEARVRLGENLAKADPYLNDPKFKENAIVVPVPDAGRSASVGYANAASLPYTEGLIKNRYLWRTFIMPGQQKRKAAVQEKLNPITSVVKGKDVILIDDSIVRGTTTSQIVKLLKEKGGAKAVHLRISCPPIISACYMGIDFPTRDELIAGRAQKLFGENYIEEIRKKIGADTLIYQNVNDLVKAISLRGDQLCLACLTGDYPLKSIGHLAEIENTIVNSRDLQE